MCLLQPEPPGQVTEGQPGSRVRKGPWWCSSAVKKSRMNCVQTLAVAEAGLDHGPEVQRAEGSDFFLHTDSDNNTFLNHFGNHHYFSHISIFEFLSLVTFRPQRVLPFLHCRLLVWVAVQELRWGWRLASQGLIFCLQLPFFPSLTYFPETPVSSPAHCFILWCLPISNKGVSM